MTVWYEVRGTVAVLQLDNPPVNGLSHAVRRAMGSHLERALDDPQVRSIAVTGTDKVFSGGADIREFNTPAMLGEPNLLQLIDAVETAPKPVVAAINGVCMGGGLELSLACHYRVATADASLALPEVRIGLIPGAGGTQRLPRAVGAQLALQMISRGEPIDAATALARGLIDRIVARDSFADVLGFCEEMAARNQRPRLRDRVVTLTGDLDAFFVAARAEVAAAARGLQAPLACASAVEAACRLPFDEGLAFERKLFIERVQADESKALRHAFFAERSAARLPDVPDSTPRRTVRRVGVIGFGTMGGGIAMSFANAGLPVRVLEQKPEALERGLATCRSNWDSSAKKGRISSAEVAARMALVTPTARYEDLADCDLVIEAVYEDLAVKQAVFEALDAVLPARAILATNTSTLDVNRIAAATRRPQDVIGMHFFSPAHVMRLLEVVRGEQTAKDVVATVMHLARHIGKIAVVSQVCDGFIGNRMLEQYVRQSLFLIDEGASPQQIDAALTQFGMAMGPFAMYDLAGMDVGYAIRQRRYIERPHVTYSRIADRVVELGRLGQKTGKGWYRYEPGNRRPQPDPEIDRLIEAHRREIGIAPRTIADEEIVQRCILALVNEGARILEEGIALRASDVDVVYLNGYGFPSAKGGPMFYAGHLIGWARTIELMASFARNEHADPRFWQPAAWIRAQAQEEAKA